MLVALLWAFTGCQQNEDPQPENSAVSTSAPTNVDFTSATFSGNVTKLGTGGVTDHGFVWGETTDPDLTAAGKQSLGAKAETGAFTHNATGLTAGKTYHVRAYVTDAQGTFYGQNQTFSTTSDPTIISFIPTQGGQNDTLTITGTNFSTTTTDITVKVGSIAVTNIVSSSATEIKAIVPSGVTEGANKVTVTVKTQEVVSTTDFTYLGGLWTQKKTFAGVDRTTETIFFTLNSKAYMGLGRTELNVSTGLDDLWEYDPTTDTWTQKANYPGGKRTAAVSFVIQDIAFVGLGTDVNTIHQKDFWQYKPATNTWTQIADFTGTPSFSQQTGFSVGGKGYVVKRDSKELWEIDLGVWKKKNNLPFTASGVYFIISDVVYFWADDQKFWKYNAGADSWSAASEDFKGGFLGRGTLNGKGYIINSAVDNAPTLEYDVTTNTVSNKKSLVGSLPGGRPTAFLTESFIIGNKIYAREKNSNTFWEFDPSK
ncbi:hypothetical protein BKI52_19310 [marine bacterium AO1-C]|nr:hypothetical protein BKI52_19310 [marine bacterium AO1-C]